MEQFLNLIGSKILPISKLRKACRNRRRLFKSKICYSQEGEDLILERMFEGKKNGFYVDVGAHHPFRFSNTALLSMRGWTGINIDPLPGTKRIFDKYRPQDINLELGVASRSGTLIYHMFNDPALNTFDEMLARERVQRGWREIDTCEIPVMPLSKVLNDFLPCSVHIDILTIDVEGFDMDVILSNDWSKYAPSVLVFEALECNSLSETMLCEAVRILSGHGYEAVAKTINTVFFKVENEHL